MNFYLEHGAWIRLLRDHGFEVLDLIEVQAPEGAPTRRRSSPPNGRAGGRRRRSGCARLSRSVGSQRMGKTAVHFGAGNIGRGFVAQFLHESGYQVIFADVNDELIGALQQQPSYQVHEVGEGARTIVVDGYRAINSRTHEDEVVAAIAEADLVTTAVGARILPFVAPVLAKGLAARTRPEAARRDRLRERDRRHRPAGRRGRASTGTRISPTRGRASPTAPSTGSCPSSDAGLDVTIESFFEWVVDRTPFVVDGLGNPPEIAGDHLGG